MAQTVKDVCTLLIRSLLYPADAVRALDQRWQAAAIDPTNAGDFLSWLVDREYLTRFQAKLFADGKGDHFFLNQYKILDCIGKGRSAGVYKAAGPGGSLVAIKVLLPSRARDPQAWARFQREARLAMNLGHPGVVRTLNLETCQGVHFLVMEYLQGETLEEVLRHRGRLPPREAVRVGFLAALGLQHLHERGMVHRDLKPANLMLCPAPHPLENTLRSMVKILDIGLGRILFDPGSREAGDDLTKEGSLVGTPDYLAPEQARDARRADIRSDLYSLGCTLYHALAGQPPFADPSPVRQILRHATQQPQPLHEVNPAVPPGLNQTILTLMAKDPTQRYQVPAQAAAALKRFLASV